MHFVKLHAQNKVISVLCNTYKRIGTVSCSTNLDSKNNSKVSKKDINNTISSAIYEQSFRDDEGDNDEEEDLNLLTFTIIQDGCTL